MPARALLCGAKRSLFFGAKAKAAGFVPHHGKSAVKLNLGVRVQYPCPAPSPSLHRNFLARPAKVLMVCVEFHVWNRDSGQHRRIAGGQQDVSPIFV